LLNERPWYSLAAVQRHSHRGHWYTSPQLLVHRQAAINTLELLGKPGSGDRNSSESSAQPDIDARRKRPL
jgi:hypothetical protein